MKILYTFLNGQLLLRFIIALLFVVPLTAIALSFGTPQNTIVLSCYALTLYTFAYLSDILADYRVLLAVSPIQQRTFLRYIFFYLLAVAICIATIYSTLAVLLHAPHLFTLLFICIAVQLALILFTSNGMYVIISITIFTLLFIFDLSLWTPAPVVLCMPLFILVTSFFLLYRSTKWRFYT